jgi:hypothetical protein
MNTAPQSTSTKKVSARRAATTSLLVSSSTPPSRLLLGYCSHSSSWSRQESCQDHVASVVSAARRQNRPPCTPGVAMSARSRHTRPRTRQEQFFNLLFFFFFFFLSGSGNKSLIFPKWTARVAYSAHDGICYIITKLNRTVFWVHCSLQFLQISRRQLPRTSLITIHRNLG